MFQWASMFPNEQTTQQESLLFVKKLLAVAVSNIAYLRAIFPEAAFGDRCLEGKTKHQESKYCSYQTVFAMVFGHFQRQNTEWNSDDMQILAVICVPRLSTRCLNLTTSNTFSKQI